MNSQRVLIVEDDELVLRLLKIGIEQLCPDCEIVGAANGLAALAELEKCLDSPCFDLVLTDYHMPEMNGIELAHAVRQSYPEMRIVMITGHPNEAELQAKVKTLNLAGFFSKPLGPEQLKEIIQTQSGNS